MSKTTVTHTRSVTRPDCVLVVAATAHKQPRLYVHKKRYPTGPKASNAQAALPEGTTINLDNWVRIDPVALAMKGAVRQL